MNADTVTRKVAGIDTICWMVKNPALKRGWEHCNASRGDVVDLPAAEADRLADYLVDPDSPDETPTPEGFVPVSDDTIAGMSVAEVTAYLGQVPEVDRENEVDRVIELEHTRDKPRTGVLALGPDFEPHPDDVDPNA